MSHPCQTNPTEECPACEAESARYEETPMETYVVIHDCSYGYEPVVGVRLTLDEAKALAAEHAAGGGMFGLEVNPAGTLTEWTPAPFTPEAWEAAVVDTERGEGYRIQKFSTASV